MAAKKGGKSRGGGGRAPVSIVPSIYDEFGRSDRGTFACAVYMARAVRRRAEEEAAYKGRRLTGAELKEVNREVAAWLFKAWSRYVKAYPTGERVQIPQTRAEIAAGAEPRYEILEPNIEYCSMFPEERKLLKFALPMAIEDANGELYIPEAKPAEEVRKAA